MFGRLSKFGAGAFHQFSKIADHKIRSGVSHTFPQLSLFHAQKRGIHFTPGTEGLRTVNDPTLQKHFADIEAVEKREATHAAAKGEKPPQEVVVLRGGNVNYYDHVKRQMFLPNGHDDPVQGSHEFQHAADYVTEREIFGQEAYERRAFESQKQTADHLGLNDQLGGKTPAQRAKAHAQVKAKPWP